MSFSRTPDINARLDLLRERFKVRVATDVARIQAIVSESGEAGPSADGISEMYGLLHGLAGAGGTFGLPELGSKARELEQALKPLAMSVRDNPASSNESARGRHPLTPVFMEGLEELAAMAQREISGK